MHIYMHFIHSLTLGLSNEDTNLIKASFNNTWVHINSISDFLQCENRKMNQFVRTHRHTY